MTMKRFLIFFLFFIILIFGSFFFLYECGRDDDDRFEILSFQQYALEKSERDYYISIDSYDGADRYVISVQDGKREIYHRETEDTKMYLDDLQLNVEQKVTFVVEAYHGDVLLTSTYMDYVGVKRPIRVYLSPSNQTNNFGVKRAGYTTEGEMMNLVGDVVEKVLLERGIVVFRNEITMDLEDIVNESMELNVDLHIALHSNALGYGDENQVRGLETWVYSRNSEIYPAALKIHQDVFDIYPYRNGDRGVRLGLDEDYIIREINPLKVNHGVLIELGFHDNYSDALWVVQNIDLIGETIGNSIAEYFGK